MRAHKCCNYAENKPSLRKSTKGAGRRRPMFISRLSPSDPISTTVIHCDKIHAGTNMDVISEEKNSCGNAAQHRIGLVMSCYHSGLFGTMSQLVGTIS